MPKKRFSLEGEAPAVDDAPTAPPPAPRSIKIFADGADLGALRELVAARAVAGCTTNPSLMRAAGVTRYRAFASKVLEIMRGLPVSLEVFADDFAGMEAQAREISSWGENVFVKIPVTDTGGRSTARVIANLSEGGVCVNVTAVFTRAQVDEVAQALGRGRAPAVISIFAGRIADAGVDPMRHVRDCRREVGHPGRVQVLWASPRQVYDVVLAEQAGCDIITMTPALIAKLPLLGKDLGEYSRETVCMFYADAQAAGYML